MTHWKMHDRDYKIDMILILNTKIYFIKLKRFSTPYKSVYICINKSFGTFVVFSNWRYVPNTDA